MHRSGVEHLLLALLDDPPEIHHRDAVGDMPHHRQIMRDEEVGEAEFALEILQQVDDLRLDRDIERRHRLVEDQHARLEGERARDADALLLPARELVREAAHHARRQPHHLEQARDPRRTAHLLVEPVDSQRLGDDLPRALDRVERGEGVLEHVLHVPAHLAHRAAAERGDVAAAETDAAAGRLH